MMNKNFDDKYFTPTDENYLSIAMESFCSVLFEIKRIMFPTAASCKILVNSANNRHLL